MLVCGEEERPVLMRGRCSREQVVEDRVNVMKLKSNHSDGEARGIYQQTRWVGCTRMIR